MARPAGQSPEASGRRDGSPEPRPSGDRVWPGATENPAIKARDLAARHAKEVVAGEKAAEEKPAVERGRRKDADRRERTQERENLRIFVDTNEGQKGQYSPFAEDLAPLPRDIPWYVHARAFPGLDIPLPNMLRNIKGQEEVAGWLEKAIPQRPPEVERIMGEIQAARESDGIALDQPVRPQELGQIRELVRHVSPEAAYMLNEHNVELRIGIETIFAFEGEKLIFKIDEAARINEAVLAVVGLAVKGLFTNDTGHFRVEGVTILDGLDAAIAQGLFSEKDLDNATLNVMIPDQARMDRLERAD